ncbi:MAG: ABC transporter ATP-binding protein [Desulfovibrio sp.]|nr:ABC transporter ATP-binding protein [Desulfovibrio sp.]
MLELEHVAKIYGLRLIFKEVSCRLTAGSTNLLVGPNGAGKSTLLRIMAGLAPASAGRVRRKEGLRPGYVGHATFLYPGLTAMENLAFWNRACGLALPLHALEGVLARVGLAAHVHERVGVFSRGMAQRLNLARMLMQEPELLLLDEPCTGLDVAAQEFLRHEIALARQRGACVVMISHDLGADAPLADQLLVLGEQRLLYAGSPSLYADALPGTRIRQKTHPAQGLAACGT